MHIDHLDSIVSKIRSEKLILFVGAGVSAQLKLPTFRELASEIAQRLGFDAEIALSRADYMTLAEYFKLKKGSLGELRSWMDEEWHASKIDIASSPVHELIVRLGVKYIYTTNFDSWLERAHKHYGVSYSRIVNVHDMADADVQDTQIVKFHGDFHDDSSLVLTETSYFERLSFESPLDIKLRADSLDKSILFIGYSLSDWNIRYLLYKLHVIWQASAVPKDRPQSYIFDVQHDDIRDEVLESRGIHPIHSDEVDPTKGLIDFLKSLREMQS